MADVKLKPCPFCGNEAIKRVTTHNCGFVDNNGHPFSDFKVYHVTCKFCGADVRSPETAPEYCEVLWNRRYQEPDTDYDEIHPFFREG